MFDTFAFVVSASFMMNTENLALLLGQDPLVAKYACSLSSIQSFRFSNRNNQIKELTAHGNIQISTRHCLVLSSKHRFIKNLLSDYATTCTLNTLQE